MFDFECNNPGSLECILGSAINAIIQIAFGLILAIFGYDLNISIQPN